MNKTALTSVLIIAAIAATCFFIKTGKLVVIWAGREYPSAQAMTPEKCAIELAKGEHTLFPLSPNEEVIKDDIEAVKGPLNVIGWKARRIDDQTFLVTYLYKTVTQNWLYVFEVNLRAGIVRCVNDNMELRKKYNIHFVN